MVIMKGPRYSSSSLLHCHHGGTDTPSQGLAGFAGGYLVAVVRGGVAGGFWGAGGI